MQVDHHTHHYRCGHAAGQLEDVIQQAIEKGFDAIGLSDHSPIYHLGEGDHVLPGTAMAISELPNYYAEMQQLKDRYRDQIDVKLGIESDHVDGYEDHYRRLWEDSPLDYVIGSVHWLGDWNIFSKELPEGKNADEVYEEYLLATQNAATSGAFDILGHLDCIKTRGHMPTREVTPLVEETIKVIGQAGVAVELNTSGWRKSVDECYPRREILERCLAHGVPVALSSDAHRPDDVGAGFDRAKRLLLDVGYTQLVTFTERKPHFYDITL